MRRGGARVLATVALLLVIVLPATGCILLAVGGAGTAAYEVAKDDRTIGTKLEDGSITSSVKTRLLTDERINALDVNVDTYEGVVTLHGHVETSGDRARAIEIARGVKGVRSVTSKLRVLPASK